MKTYRCLHCGKTVEVNVKPPSKANGMCINNNSDSFVHHVWSCENTICNTWQLSAEEMRFVSSDGTVKVKHEDRWISLGLGGSN